MWREPGFNTRNMQARQAKFPAPVAGDTTMFRPVKAYPARDMRLFAKGPNLQQLPKAMELPRFADLPPFRMGMAADGAVIVGGRCNCSMCRKVDGMGARMVAWDDVANNRRVVEPSFQNGVARVATSAEIEDAKAIALKAGQINQSLHDAFNMIPGRVSLYNYAKSRPWMQEVTNFMQSKGWKYAGGGYFSVVFTKGELAIKLGTKAEDSGAAYAAWARDNQGLAGVPVIHHIERFGRQSYTVLMPRYQEVNDYEQALRVKDGRMGEVSVTYEKIAKFFKGVAEMDLHGDNIMRDPITGTIIITDPVSFKAGQKPGF